MSKYTTEVRFICENAAELDESKGYNSLDDILEAGREQIFDFDYPIFDESYRNVLETKILKHYYTREISEETVGLWKLRLNSRMNEIMPFYNKLYKSELLSFNPLYDVNYTRSGQRHGDETKTENTSSVNTNTDNMTGTVADMGFSNGSDTMRGTVTDDGKQNSMQFEQGHNTDTEKMTGDVKDSSVTTNVGTDKIESNSKEKNSDIGTRDNKGRETNSGTTTNKSVGTSEKNTTNSGEDTDTTNRDNVNDHWDYYSDTPQGTIGFIPGSEGEPQATGQLANQTYLTNARHITDDSTGSEEVKTTEYGHIVNEAITNTNNAQGTDESTLTRDNKEIETKEGQANRENTENKTSESTGTGSNVKVYDTVNEKTGGNEKTITGDSKDNNVRTYDTENAKSGESTNTRTYNTLNTRKDNGATETSGQAKNLEEYTEMVVGKQGTMSFSKMLMEFRETFLNIDMMIIENLSDLFFGLWG